MPRYSGSGTCISLPIIALLFAIALSWQTAHAAAITILAAPDRLQPKGTDTSEHLTLIRLTGTLVEGDSERLRAILTRLRNESSGAAGPPAVAIELSSNGGDVYEGLNIGYLLREFDVASVVRKGDQCLSACALAFLGGTANHFPPALLPDRRIEIGAVVGFHNFFLNPYSEQLPAVTNPIEGMVVGFDLARDGSSLLVRYAGMMGIEPTFVARLLGRPPEMWDYVDRDGKFLDLASCPLTVTRPAQSDAEIATNICNHATAGFEPVSASKARPLAPHDARRWLLGYVQRNVAGLSLKGPLVAQLNAALAGRDDRAVDALYDELRKAGVRLPEFLDKIYEVGGYRFGAYEMQCHVSMSSTDPDRYEVAITGPAGLSRAYKFAPEKCKRLFLFDRWEMLNPPKLEMGDK